MADTLKIIAIAIPCLLAFRFALALDGARTGAAVPYRRVRHFARVLGVGFIATQCFQSFQPRGDGAFLAQMLIVAVAMYATHRLSRTLDRAAAGGATDGAGWVPPRGGRTG